MKPLCSIQGCERYHHGRGFCKKHWDRWMRNGDTDLHPILQFPCTAAGCQTLAVARSLCGMHYQRWRKHGATAAPVQETAEERFAKYVEVNTKTDCWEWTGANSRRGYGAFHKERLRPAHRVAWEFVNGEIPEGLFVLHNCPHGDNPRCVNPDHLFLGTQKDNMADMDAKGRRRTPAGEKHPRSKLLDAEVIEIKHRLADNEQCAEIAKDFSVTRSLIAHIKRGESWKHVGI